MKLFLFSFLLTISLFWNTSSTEIVASTAPVFQCREDSCICQSVYSLSLTSPLSRDSLLSKLVELSRSKGFNRDLLKCLWDQKSIRTDSAFWYKVTGLFLKYNQSLADMAGTLVESARYLSADTLYTMIDRSGRIDIYDLLQWARIKDVLGSSTGASILYCRIASTERAMTQLVFSQMYRSFDDANTDSVRVTLNTFRHCYLSKPGADTVMLRGWMSDIYARLAMYDDEVEVLRSLDIPSSPSARRLLEAARDRFSRHVYAKVIAPARMAFDNIKREELKVLAATLLYQGYLEIGKKDSALVWLEKADLKNEKRRSDAVVLYQSTGHLKKALALIDPLPQSINRDTLLFRQWVYSGELSKILESTRTTQPIWRSNMKDLTLWRLRGFLFDGNISGFSEIIDTLSVSPSWHAAQEVLGYRYWLKLLGNAPEALKMWGKVESALFTEDVFKAGEIILKQKLPSEQGASLAIRVAKVHLLNNDPSLALKVLGLYDNDEITTEYMYYKAEALLGSGDIASAQQLLQKIVMDFSSDIFSSKARIILSRIQPKS